MLDRYTQPHGTWIDLFSPTQEEAREAMELAKIPPELLSDISGPVPRSSAVQFGTTIKLTVDYPVVKRTDLESPHEIKFFINKDALVTAHYEDISAFHKFRSNFEMLSILGKTESVTSGHLFTTLMHVLYDALAGKLEYLETKLESIQCDIFNDHEQEMVFEISKISRKLIVFRQTLLAHGDVMHDARPMFIALFGKEFDRELIELREFYDHLMRRLSTITETTYELRTTNQILLSTKQNDIMKKLTVTAFIGFPLTLILSIFNIPATGNPFRGTNYDFAVILGIMAATALCLILYFRHRRWF